MMGYGLGKHHHLVHNNLHGVTTTPSSITCYSPAAAPIRSINKLIGTRQESTESLALGGSLCGDKYDNMPCICPHALTEEAVFVIFTPPSKGLFHLPPTHLSVTTRAHPLNPRAVFSSAALIGADVHQSSFGC